MTGTQLERHGTVTSDRGGRLSVREILAGEAPRPKVVFVVITSACIGRHLSADSAVHYKPQCAVSSPVQNYPFNVTKLRC